MLRAPCVQEPKLEPGRCLGADLDSWPPRWSAPNIHTLRSPHPAQLAETSRGLRNREKIQTRIGGDGQSGNGAGGGDLASESSGVECCFGNVLRYL